MDNVGWVRFASCAALCAVMDFHGRWFVHWLSSREQLTNASPFIINSLIKCSSYLPIDDKLSSWTDLRLAELFSFKIQSGDSRLSYQFSKFSFKNYFEKGKMFKNVFDFLLDGAFASCAFSLHHQLNYDATYERLQLTQTAEDRAHPPSPASTFHASTAID